MRDDWPEVLSRWLAIATCTVCAVPLLARMAREPELAMEPRWQAWFVLLVVFLACFWIFTGARWATSPRRKLGGLAVLAVLALAMTWLVPYSLTGVYLVIVAGGLGELSALRWAAAWIVAQTAGFTLPLLVDHGLADAATIGAAFLGFQFFALYAAHTAERERRGRQALARVNAELLATRRLLEESSRTEERLRIARDLHDGLGHHLTALSMHLEVARCAPPGEAQRTLTTAHEIAGGLLAEVRRVVGLMREERPVELAGSIAALAAGIERPRVHLALAESPRASDREQAQALLRCAQEMMTNAVRHARADNLWIELVDGPDGLELTARDDGEGVADGAARVDGVGLAGMRERLERLGGRLAIENRPGDGFRVTARLPGTASPGDL